MSAIAPEVETTDPRLAAIGAALARGIVQDEAASPPEEGLFANEQGRPVSLARAAEDLLAYAEQKVDLDALTLRLPATIAEIVAVLRRFGVVILPALLEGPALEALREDFADTIRDHEALAERFEVSKAEHTVCVRVDRSKLPPGLMPAVEAFYGDPVLSAIAERVYGSSEFVLNRQIFIQETRETRAPLSGELHFDVSRMVKFWVYLDEGRRETGAIRITPGSHLWIRKLREEFSERLIPKKQIFNEVDEAAHPPLSIEAPAGSLVIFDTDAAHGAGQVQAGLVRRILRGHTIDRKLLDRTRKRQVS